MSPEAPSPITGLLRSWSGGDPGALDQLIPLVYKELRRMARRYTGAGHGEQTLQTTALVHEAYLRLVNSPDIDWQNRVHFFAVAATAMRRILVDRARERASLKRGGSRRANPASGVDFDAVPDLNSTRDSELIALDDALREFSELEPRRSRVVELRFFGGLTIEEIAGVLDVSPQTVMRDWKLAKAWLMRELSR